MSQRFLSSLNYKALLSVVVPALLIASLSVYVLGFRAKPSECVFRAIVTGDFAEA